MGGNIRQFIETCSDRNLLNDEALKHLVEKARLMVDGVSPRKLCVSADVRARALAHLVRVKTFVDGAGHGAEEAEVQL
jgi:hypothetical protein